MQELWHGSLQKGCKTIQTIRTNGKKNICIIIYNILANLIIFFQCIQCDFNLCAANDSNYVAEPAPSPPSQEGGKDKKTEFHKSSR